MYNYVFKGISVLYVLFALVNGGDALVLLFWVVIVNLVLYVQSSNNDLGLVAKIFYLVMLLGPMLYYSAIYGGVFMLCLTKGLTTTQFESTAKCQQDLSNVVQFIKVNHGLSDWL